MSNIELRNENGKVVGYDPETGNKIPVSVEDLDVDNATIMEQIDPADMPHTIYVRSDGDDSNSGLSASDAVATLDKAVDLVSHVPTKRSSADVPTHVINVESSQVFTIDNRIRTTWPWAGKVRFEASGSNRAIFEVAGSLQRAMDIKTCRVGFEKIHFRPADFSNQPDQFIKIAQNAAADIRNCKFEEGLERQILVDKVSYATIYEGTVLTGRGNGTSSKGVWVHGNSHVLFGNSGTGIIENMQRGIYGTRAGSWAQEGGTIRGCDVAMEAGDTAVGKARDGTIENCDTGFKVTNDGFLKLEASASLSGVSNFYEVAGEGRFKNNNTDETVVGIGPNRVTYRDPNDNGIQNLLDDRVQNIKPVQFFPCSSEPPSPDTGFTCIADGTNWDPDGDGNAEKVTWNGSSWVEETDYGTSF